MSTVTLMRELEKLRRDVDTLRAELQRQKAIRRPGAQGFARLAIVTMAATIGGRTRTGDASWQLQSGTVNIVEVIASDATYTMQGVASGDDEPATGTLVNTWRGDIDGSTDDRPVTIIAGQLRNRLWVPLSAECNEENESIVAVVGVAAVGTATI